MNCRRNESSVIEFLLLGVSLFGKAPAIFFLVFSLTYGTILAFNVTVMSVVVLDSTLHRPMYFLLLALSASEICGTFAIIPKFLVTLLTGNSSISFTGCAVQMFCYFNLGANNCFLLVTMAYDRYVAICHPLHYQVLMDKRVCAKVVAASYGAGCITAVSLDILIFRLPFCGPYEIRHFFCDLSPVLILACTDTHLTKTGVVLICAFALLGTVISIFVSYTYVFLTILRIDSRLGRQKAFSICASHLTVVITHFGCASFVYLRPKFASSPDLDTLLSLVYIFLIPLLHPVIYTLRNKEVKLAIEKWLRNANCSQKF